MPVSPTTLQAMQFREKHTSQAVPGVFDDMLKTWGIPKSSVYPVLWHSAVCLVVNNGLLACFKPTGTAHTTRCNLWLSRKTDSGNIWVWIWASWQCMKRGGSTAATKGSRSASTTTPTQLQARVARHPDHHELQTHQHLPAKQRCLLPWWA